MNRFGYYAFGESGRWMAVVPPLDTRRLKFHLMAKSHDTKGMAVRGDDGKVEWVKNYAISFNFTEMPEGEFAEPTLSSLFHHMGNGDLMHFLQAVSDCAASMGIYPSGAKDTTKETSALRAHLEDMRALVGVRAKEVGKINA